MARGRMIANAITLDKRVNSLSSDTCRLAFTWLVTFADCEGRTYGDPALVRSMLFPRRDDVTAAQVEGFIKEWAQAGLVVWYEAAGDQWLFFPAFAKNQPGLRKEKEQPSVVPAPPEVRTEDGVSTDLVRTEDGLGTGLVRSRYGVGTPQENGTEEKLNRNEENGKRTETKGAAGAALGSVPPGGPDSVSMDAFDPDISTEGESPELEECIRRWSGAFKDSAAVESNLTQIFAIWSGYPQIRAPDMIRLVNETGTMVQAMRNIQKPMAYFFRSIRGHLERKLGPPRATGRAVRVPEAPQRGTGFVHVGALGGRI